MSDVNNVNEALEAIKTDVNTAVETKATIETVEANKAEAVESIEAVKASMEVAATEAKAQSEKMEALEAKFAAMPIISTEIKKESKMEFTQDLVNLNKSSIIVDIFSKAGYTDNTDVTGGNVASGNLIHTLVQANPFRTYGTVIQTNSGSIKLPQLSSVAFAAEATNNPSRTAGGSLTSQTVVVDNFVAQNEISKPAAEDIMGLDAIMGSHMTQSAGFAESADAVAALSAASFTAVNTGLATALPAATAIVAKLADMASNLSSAYTPNAKWYMSREALSVVRQSNDTVLNFDASLGLFTIFGYAVVIVDQIADGTTAADNSVYFGDMSKGLAVVSRKELEISRFMETSPGMVTYFGDLRSKAAAWDLSSLIVLNSAI